MKYFPVYLLLLLGFLCGVYMLMTYTPQYKSDPVGDLGEYQYDFTYIVVDNMPCIINDEYRGVAITCDWSQWNGRVVDGEIVIGD